MNKTITVNGQAFSLRPLTYAEVKKLRADKETLPYEAPATWVVPENALDALPFPDVKQLADEVYDLTFGKPETEGN